MHSPPGTTPPPPPFPPRAPRSVLRRDRANGILGGVCAGVAETYGLDVTLVRVLWVVAGVLWIGVPAYIVAWIAIAPADGPIEHGRRFHDPGMLVGLVLVGIGALIASNRLLPHGFRFDHFGAPLLLIGGGLAILLLRRRDDEPRADEPRADRPGPAMPAAGSEPGVTPARTGTDDDNNPDHDGVVADGDDTSATAPTPPVPPSAWTQTAPWPAPPSARSLRRASRLERRARRPRSFLTPLTLSALLIGGGIASLLEATGALDVNLTVLLAIGTCVVGAALAVAAFAGRAHTLILVGAVLLAATAISSSLDVSLRGGIGSREYRPVRLSEVKDQYRFGIGELRVDLRDAPLTGHTTSVEAQVGVGHVLVSVPSSVRVEVHAHAGAGLVTLFGRDQSGWPQDETRAVDGTGAGLLRLDVRVGAGHVEVRRFEPGGIETIFGGN